MSATRRTSVARSSSRRRARTCSPRDAYGTATAGPASGSPASATNGRPRAPPPRGCDGRRCGCSCSCGADGGGGDGPGDAVLSCASLHPAVYFSIHSAIPLAAAPGRGRRAATSAAVAASASISFRICRASRCACCSVRSCRRAAASSKRSVDLAASTRLSQLLVSPSPEGRAAAGLGRVAQGSDGGGAGGGSTGGGWGG
eukprot:scaffold115182_cov45-Phaeocystis_antarctica.AAC.2